MDFYSYWIIVIDNCLNKTNYFVMKSIVKGFFWR